MDETYGTYVDDACFDIHDYDDDTDQDIDDGTDDDTDDDTNDDTDDGTDDGERGNPRPLPGGAVHFPPPRPMVEFISQMMMYDEAFILDIVLARMSILEEEIRT